MFTFRSALGSAVERHEEPNGTAPFSVAARTSLILVPSCGSPEHKARQNFSGPRRIDGEDCPDLSAD